MHLLDFPDDLLLAIASRLPRPPPTLGPTIYTSPLLSLAASHDRFAALVSHLLSHGNSDNNTTGSHPPSHPAQVSEQAESIAGGSTQCPPESKFTLDLAWPARPDDDVATFHTLTSQDVQILHRLPNVLPQVHAVTLPPNIPPHALRNLLRTLSVHHAPSLRNLTLTDYTLLDTPILRAIAPLHALRTLVLVAPSAQTLRKVFVFLSASPSPPALTHVRLARVAANRECIDALTVALKDDEATCIHSLQQLAITLDVQAHPRRRQDEHERPSLQPLHHGDDLPDLSRLAHCIACELPASMPRIQVVSLRPVQWTVSVTRRMLQFFVVLRDHRLPPDAAHQAARSSLRDGDGRAARVPRVVVQTSPVEVVVVRNGADEMQGSDEGVDVQLDDEDVRHPCTVVDLSTVTHQAFQTPHAATICRTTHLRTSLDLHNPSRLPPTANQAGTVTPIFDSTPLRQALSSRRGKLARFSINLPMTMQSVANRLPVVLHNASLVLSLVTPLRTLVLPSDWVSIVRDSNAGVFRTAAMRWQGVRSLLLAATETGRGGGGRVHVADAVLGAGELVLFVEVLFRGVDGGEGGLAAVYMERAPWEVRGEGGVPDAAAAVERLARNVREKMELWSATRPNVGLHSVFKQLSLTGEENVVVSQS